MPSTDQLVVAAAVLCLVAEPAKPHCNETCGTVSIPYPFGIRTGCFSIHGDFSLKCVHNQIIWRDNKVLDINIHGKMTISHNISYDCYGELGESTGQSNVNLSAGNFIVSADDNKLVAIGCDTYAWFKGYKNETPYWVGCMTYCTDLSDVPDGECSGVGCCQANITYATPNITTALHSFDDHVLCEPFNPCSSAFVVAKNAFTFNKTILTTTVEEYKKHLNASVVLSWTVGNQTCSSAKADRTCLCQGNTTCYDPPNEVGYRCKCFPGYDGNPYLSPGCQGTYLQQPGSVNSVHFSHYYYY
ncbi:hypothetical protein Ancab_010571 [Ancistrocladus abbreviatus]